MSDENLVFPDFIEPVLGWRAWNITERPCRLRSVVNDAEWPTDGPLRATCVVSPLLHHEHDPRVRTGGVPQEYCTCGIYATSDIPKAVSYTGSGHHHGRAVMVALGVVSLWGRIIEHTRGWRAQYGYPRLLILLPPTRHYSDMVDVEWFSLSNKLHYMQTIETHAIAERLASAYGVPTFLGPTNDRAELSNTRLEGILSDIRFQLARHRTLENVGLLSERDVRFFEDRLVIVHKLTRIP